MGILKNLHSLNDSSFSCYLKIMNAAGDTEQFVE